MREAWRQPRVIVFNTTSCLSVYTRKCIWGCGAPPVDWAVNFVMKISSFLAQNLILPSGPRISSYIALSAFSAIISLTDLTTSDGCLGLTLYFGIIFRSSKTWQKLHVRCDKRCFVWDKRDTFFQFLRNGLLSNLPYRHVNKETWRRLI